MPKTINEFLVYCNILVSVDSHTVCIHEWSRGWHNNKCHREMGEITGSEVYWCLHRQLSALDLWRNPLAGKQVTQTSCHRSPVFKL